MFSPRIYQKAAANAAVQWLNHMDSPAIVVVPTGGGKSIIIKMLAEHYAGLGKRVLILAHRKELLEQTGGKIKNLEVGYYSASIGEKRLDCAITIAGIQSIAVAKDAPQYDVILLDECHLRSNNQEDETRYNKFLGTQENAKIAGFTATPYRLKGGAIEWGHVVYDVSYEALLKEGYLCPLTNKIPKDMQNIDLSDIPVKMGDYVKSKLAEVMEHEYLVQAGVAAMLTYTRCRNSVLVFAVSIAHAAILVETLADNDEHAEMISGETPKAQRAEIIERFQAGEIRYLINCEVLTTGFDAPNIDAIVCLRPTQSKALWEQMCGRGVRLHHEKENCLLLDMGGNLRLHGALGTPYKEKGKKNETRQEPSRICPECETFEKPNAKQCGDCGFVFPEVEAAKANHEEKPDLYSAENYSGSVETYAVRDVSYNKHVSRKSGNESLKVVYYCDFGKYGNVAEWLSVKHQNDWARNKAISFFKERGVDLINPIDMEWEDILFEAEKLKKPSQIVVDHREEFPRIIRYEWGEVDPQKELDDLLDDEIPY